MSTPQEQFLTLVGRVLDGEATAAEREAFRVLLREHPELIDAYRQQTDLDTLICWKFGKQARESKRGRPPRNAETARREAETKTGVPAGRRRGWWKVAAAAAVLAGGAAVWREWAAATSGPADGPWPIVVSSVSPVRLMRQTDVSTLELPQALPGSVRLAGGEATVRLASGVELTLLGPASLEVENVLEVRLENGRLLANVPHWATGFIVHAPGLEVWDLGTVFCVSAVGGASDVFVFKGSVQVNEESGSGIGICEAGQGVRAAAGERPQLFAADWAGAQKLFAAVRGAAALSDAPAAFAAAGQIADLWQARYAPKPQPGPVAGLRGMAVGSRQSEGGGTVPRTVRRAGGARPGAGISKTTAGAKEFSSANKEIAMKESTTVAAVAAAAVLGTAGAAWSVPEVSGVTMTQRANSRIVDIEYTLAGEAAIMTLGIETNGVPIPDSAVTRLSGDVSTVVQPGARSIVWNAGADWPEHSVTNARARVTAWSTNAPPLYCAVDVVGGPATNSYPIYYYASAEAVPNGVTNDLYKTTRILMRKVPATGVGGFKMGSPSNETGRDATREDWHDVVLTKDYYAGVFEITQSQWQQVMGDVRSWPAKWSNNDYKLTRPVEQVSYYEIRENNNNTDDAAVNWPANDLVTASSFMGRLRTKTGLAGFDLPTEAQWEHACRAGTTGALNDGTTNITNSNSDARLDLLGRYERNGGKVWSGSAWTEPALNCTTENGTAAVGAYQPNAWGLYDMHGNVFEWCLDWFVASLGTGTVSDPVGASSGGSRVVRGGTWYYVASDCRSAARKYEYNPVRQYSYFGFRLFRTLP